MPRIAHSEKVLNGKGRVILYENGHCAGKWVYKEKIEGSKDSYKTKVIDGANNIITSNKPVLLVEIEEKHTKKPITETINKIKNFGYNCYQFKKNEISEFDLENHNVTDNNFIFISD